MAGSMDEVITKNMTLGESMGNLRRQMVVALEPAAQELLPLLGEGVSKVSEFLTLARPIFTGFAGELSDKLGPALQIIGDSLARVGAVFGIVSEDASGMDTALKILEGTLDLIVTAIEAVAVVSKLLADAFEIGKGLGQQLGVITGAAVETGKGLGQQLGVITGAAAETEGLGSQVGQIGELLGFQEGGVVPGATGAPRLAVVHGGETITPPGQGGGGLTINIIDATVFGVDDLDAKLTTWGQGIIDAVAGAMN
ncbi:hypothetical protein LCGC14_2916700, partial [marine sediment metagenome]